MAQLTPTTEQTKITKSTPTTTYHSTTVNNTTPPPTQLPTSITNVPTLATLSPTPASHKNEDILLPTTSTATTDHSSEHVFVHPLLAPASQLGRSVPRPRRVKTGQSHLPTITSRQVVRQDGGTVQCSHQPGKLLPQQQQPGRPGGRESKLQYSLAPLSMLFMNKSLGQERK